MNIDHSYKESFFGTLPWMFMNILTSSLTVVNWR